MNTIDALDLQRTTPTPGARVGSIGHILVCLDRTAVSRGCLPYAKLIASAFEARVTLLHVMKSTHSRHEPNPSDALNWQITKREAEKYLAHASESLAPETCESATRLEQGLPSEQIVAVALETGADLTVLSRRGDDAGGRSDLGSVAQRVLAESSGSVLLFPPGCAAHVPPRRILVPLDGSIRAESVLPIVAELARVEGAEVILVHVVSEPIATAVLSLQADMDLAQSLAARVHANAEEYLVRVRARLVGQVENVKVLVAQRPDERQALLDLGVEHSVDMIVFSAHGSTCNPERSFGSVASYLLAHAPLPTLVLQDMTRSASAQSGERLAPSPSVRPLARD